MSLNDNRAFNLDADDDKGSKRPENVVQSPSTPPVAPTEKCATYYNMHHPKRGMALIFNHEDFLDPNMPKREGTNVDCEALQNTWETLGFDVRVYNNSKREEIAQNLEKVALMDHSNHDCLAITVLTHGDQGVLHAYDATYKLEDIVSNFKADKCLTLAGKPKMFFIQACRGRRYDSGVRFRARLETDGQPADTSFGIPSEADFLISFATGLGYVSWRNRESGSWYIQTLCDELNKNGSKYDIFRILTHVTQRVALDCEVFDSDPEKNLKKQVPRFESTLTRILMFPPISKDNDNDNVNVEQKIES